MGSFKTITDADISQTTSVLNQLVDVIQEDISGSATRKKYQVFVTGGIGPGVTSSLFQTVYRPRFLSSDRKCSFRYDGWNIFWKPNSSRIYHW